MMRILLIFIFILMSFSLHAKKFVIVGDPIYITDKGKIFAAFQDYKESYTPKLFPEDYKIIFQTKNAYKDFMDNSIIFREIVANVCHEYTVYNGKVVLHKRYKRSEYCYDNYPKNMFSCELLEKMAFFDNTEDYLLEYVEESFLISESCSAKLLYKLETIDEQTQKRKCEVKEIELGHKEGRQVVHSSIKKVGIGWIILENGSVIDVIKTPLPDQYYFEENGIYFETKKAFDLFNKKIRRNLISGSDPLTKLFSDAPNCMLQYEYNDYKSRQIKLEDSECSDIIQ